MRNQPGVTRTGSQSTPGSTESHPHPSPDMRAPRRGRLAPSIQSYVAEVAKRERPEVNREIVTRSLGRRSAEGHVLGQIGGEGAQCQPFSVWNLVCWEFKLQVTLDVRLRDTVPRQTFSLDGRCRAVSSMQVLTTRLTERMP